MGVTMRKVLQRLTSDLAPHESGGLRHVQIETTWRPALEPRPARIKDRLISA